MPGGSCNVKCSDLYDDDIADDVLCAQRILDGHGLEGWGTSEEGCRHHQEKVDSCLETIDEFEDEIEMLFPTDKNNSTSARLDSTTTLKYTTALPLTESITKVSQFLSDRDANLEENIFWTVRSFLIFIMLMFTVITVGVIYTRYHRIERYFRATFTDAVQLVNS